MVFLVWALVCLVLPLTQQIHESATVNRWLWAMYYSTNTVKFLGYYIAGYYLKTYTLNRASEFLVYILGVLLTATWTEGRLYGILSSLLSVLTFNFFFTEPYFSLDAHPSYVITFFIMFLSSFLTSSLTIRIKTQARMAVQKNYSTEVLLEATQLLQQASGEHEVLAIAVSQLGKLLDRPILYYPMDPDGQLMQARIYPETESNLLSRYTGGQEKAVADWVCKNNKHAGAGTHTLPNSRCLYLAVRSHGGPQAVVGIPCDDYPLPEAFEQNLIRGILNQAGIVLEQRLSDLRRADTPFQGDSL